MNEYSATFLFFLLLIIILLGLMLDAWRKRRERIEKYLKTTAEASQSQAAGKLREDELYKREQEVQQREIALQRAELERKEEDLKRREEELRKQGL